MEKFEDGEHEANGHVHAYERRKAVERATEQIIRAEEKERPHMDNDEMNEVERGQQFVRYNFLR